MSRRRGIGALAAAVVLGASPAACGTPSPDLFVVQRSGDVPGARLRLLVSDGSVRCNGGAERALSSAQLIEARQIARRLEELGAVPESPRRIFAFAVRFETGTVRFADTVTRPPVLPRIARFTRTAAQDLCGLER